jgi:hypothetical protein
MSLLTDIIDAIDARLLVVFPNHNILSDPYTIQNNTELALKQAYGLAIGSGLNTNRQVGCDIVTVKRDLVVTLTENFITRELDQTTKEATVKSLIEDQLLLIKEFEKDPTIQYSLSNRVTNFLYVSDGGVQPIFSGRGDYLMIQSTFSLEFFEQY